MGKSTGNHGFSHEIWGFPVFFPQTNPFEQEHDYMLRADLHRQIPGPWAMAKFNGWCQELAAKKNQQMLGGCYPLGKLSHNYGKSPFLMGKLTIIRVFSIAMLNYQRVVVNHPSRW